MAEMSLIEVRTGSRLHFGLLELCHSAPMCFGGLGLMVEQPEFRLRASVDSDATAHTDSIRICVNAIPPEQEAELRARIAKVVHDWRNVTRCDLPLLFECQDSLPMHTGLGAGTQTACGVALACYLLEPQVHEAFTGSGTEEDWQPVSKLEVFPRELPQRSNRGARSAIGLSGFLHGGLVLDHGYNPANDSQEPKPVREIATHRIPVPEAWRVVLAQPNSSPAVSGSKEADVFARLRQSPNPNRERMLELSENAMQAAKENDFPRFCSGLEEYMELAGELFREVQGGLYNGVDVERCVGALRAAGLAGIGQSSWGPTVFGFADCKANAEHAIAKLNVNDPGTCYRIVQPAVAGAQFRVRHKI